MYSLESYDTSRTLRTLTTMETVGAMDEARWSRALHEDTRQQRTRRPVPVTLRASYDIRSAWRGMACTA